MCPFAHRNPAVPARFATETMLLSPQWETDPQREDLFPHSQFHSDDLPVCT